MLNGYDIIGDIHGCADKLEALLSRLGYLKQGGVWKHADRIAVFLGDYIDRGPEILETLKIVRDMRDAGSAVALMGNQEHARSGAPRPASAPPYRKEPPPA